MLDEKIKRTIMDFQKNEITEHNVYRNLAQKTKGKNATVLERISEDELRHYNEWKGYTQTDISPNKWAILKFLAISKIFGLTFAFKMMEEGEKEAEEIYTEITSAVPRAKSILEDEIEHEKLLINMIDEEKIGYIGSMVLGLNDALVELTGALAGFTFTFQNTRLIGAAGLVTGIAASLSMSASEYLSQKSEKGKNPIKASFYTGIAYILTVLILIFPYFVFTNYYIALGITILEAILVVLVFTFFISVVKELSFRKMFLEILFISLGVAAVSFIIGWATKQILNIEI
jgi:VIT1/CCC1 family predicted Fe2+/Mn2+ transporter